MWKLKLNMICSPTLCSFALSPHKLLDYGIKNCVVSLINADYTRRHFDLIGVEGGYSDGSKKLFLRF